MEARGWVFLDQSPPSAYRLACQLAVRGIRDSRRDNKAQHIEPISEHGLVHQMVTAAMGLYDRLFLDQ